MVGVDNTNSDFDDKLVFGNLLFEIFDSKLLTRLVKDILLEPSVYVLIIINNYYK